MAEVCRFDSRWGYWEFLVTKSFRSHNCPGFDLVSKRNLIQWVKLKTLPRSCAVLEILQVSTAWSPHSLSRPVPSTNLDVSANVLWKIVALDRDSFSAVVRMDMNFWVLQNSPNFLQVEEMSDSREKKKNLSDIVTQLTLLKPEKQNFLVSCPKFYSMNSRISFSENFTIISRCNLL
jgi:hypothetical protein